MDNVNPISTDTQQQVDNELSFDQSLISRTDAIELKIPDDELVKLLKPRVKLSQDFFNAKYKLDERREKNEKYRFGRQLDDKEFAMKYKDYETRTNDNVIYEIESTIKPLAMAKIPDIIITPGGNDPIRVESAKNLTTVIDDVNKKREQRRTVGIAFQHVPVYYTGIIKARWNPEKGNMGDYEFIVKNPKYIVVDSTATSNNADDMGFIAECIPISLRELFMKFPSKKDDITKEAQRLGLLADGATGDQQWKDMASEVKYWEIWFDWYKKKDKEELYNKPQAEAEGILEPGIQWEKVAGVLWLFGDSILDKMLDPNYDWEGEKKLFMYTDPQDENSKQEVDPQDIVIAQLSGLPIPDVKEEMVYHNYFDRPHKPYYFMGYEQWGKIPYDETSRIEQNIRNQENLNDQQKTVIDQLKKRVKHIWSKDSGMDKGAVQRTDMDNPRMDVLVEGNPNMVHAEVKPERPDSAQFNAINDGRSRMYAISGSTAIRGQLQSQVATSNQIAREADFTRSDDLVEETINPAYEWMAMWQMQFIKLRYTQDHMMEVMGKKGEYLYIRLRRDVVTDGMEVRTKASSTDKLKAQRNAMDSAKLGPPFTNPLDFFKDMDMPDAEGRAERGIMFALDPQGYFTKYVLGMETVTQQIDALNGAQPTQPNQPTPGAQPFQGQSSGGSPAPSEIDTTQIPEPPTGAPQGSPRTI